MAQLKDTLIAGDLRVTGNTYINGYVPNYVYENPFYSEIIHHSNEILLNTSNLAQEKGSYVRMNEYGVSIGTNYSNAEISLVAENIVPVSNNFSNLGSSTLKWKSLYTNKINDINIPSITAQTTQAVYPIKINAIGQITSYGNAVTLGTLAGKSSIADHTYVKATGTSRSTDVALNSTTVNSITAVGTLPSLTITSTTVVTGGSTTNIPNISKKTVVTDATAAKATYASGILSISDGSVTKGDSVSVGTAIAAYTSLTSGSVGSASNWSAGTLPTKGSNTTVATTVKTQPAFSITTENATLSHTIS